MNSSNEGSFIVGGNEAGPEIVTETEEFRLVRAMKDHGGAFASNLAKAWAVADLSNRAKLRREFGSLLISFRPFLPAGS